MELSQPRILIYPAGVRNRHTNSTTDAVSQHRLLLPAQVLQAQGYDVAITWAGPRVLRLKSPFRETCDTDPVIEMVTKPTADVVVMQRPARRWWADLITTFHDYGVKVIVDVDDLFSHLDPGHIAIPGLAPAPTKPVSYEFVAEACKKADLVTCSTPYLLEHYGFGHGVVLPNMVPARYLDAYTSAERQWIGWSGNVDTHPKDLPMCGTAVRHALEDCDWAFHVIGNVNNVRKQLRLREEPTTAGWVPWLTYPTTLAQLTIGIVPLARTLFNRAKSAITMMCMAATRVPCVVSPTEDNLRMHREGIGLVAKNPDDWYKYLKALMTSEGLREEVVSTGYEAIRRWTYEDQAWRWAEAWSGVSLRSRSVTQF